MNISELYQVFVHSKEYESLSESRRQKMTYAWARWKELYTRGVKTLTVNDLESVIQSQTTTYYPAKDMKELMSHLYRIAIK